MANLTVSRVKAAIEATGRTFTVYEKVSKKEGISHKYMVCDYQNIVIEQKANTLKEVAEYFNLKFPTEVKAAKTPKAPKTVTNKPAVKKLSDIKAECFVLLGVNDIKAVKKMFPSTNLRLKDSWLQIIDGRQPEQVIDFKKINKVDSSRIYSLSETKAIAASKNLEVVVNMDNYSIEITKNGSPVFHDLSMRSAYEYVQAA